MQISLWTRENLLIKNIIEIELINAHNLTSLSDIAVKMNEIEPKTRNFMEKIEKIAVNFKLCIKLLGYSNIQELSCVNIIFMLQFFPNGYIKCIDVNVKFTSEDIPIKRIR